jgi:hypothetical protein
MCVKDDISKETGREFGRLLVDGCNIHTVNLIVARTFKMCESTKCVLLLPGHLRCANQQSVKECGLKRKGKHELFV